MTEQTCSQGLLIILKLIEMMWPDFQCYAKHDKCQAYIEHDEISGGEIDIYRFGFQGFNGFCGSKLVVYCKCIQSKSASIHSTSFR